MVQADVGRIMEAYRHAGRDDVGVVPKIIDRGNDRVDLVYEVTEGQKTTVRQINFVGNTVFGKRQLAAVIKTSATNMLSFLTGGDRVRSRPGRRPIARRCGNITAARAMPTPA